MAGVIVNKVGERIDVTFGDYWRDSGSPYASNEVASEFSSYHTRNIDEVWKDGNDVFVRMKDRREWQLGVTQTPKNFVVASVNAVVPTDAAHLYDLLKQLI